MSNEKELTLDELLSSPFRIYSVTTHNSSLLTETKRLFHLDHDGFRRMMRVAHLQLVRELEREGVRYKNVANALMPTRERKEIVLLFDSQVASARSHGFYALDIAEAWIPALPKTRNGVPVNSILRGDIVHGTTDEVSRAFQESVVYHQPFMLSDPVMVYCVYIQNLSAMQADEMRKAAQQHPAYFGYADCTRRNSLKKYLGMSLPKVGMRVGDKILDGVYEDEAPNPIGLPFQEHGYTPVGIRLDLYLPFLSYRINTHLSGRNAHDSYAALATLSPEAPFVEKPTIWMTPGRYEYLHDKKLASLQAAGLDLLDRPALESRLSALVSEGHLYNLRYEHGALMYSARVEFEIEGGNYKAFDLGLKFTPEDRRVELVTFY